MLAESLWKGEPQRVTAPYAKVLDLWSGTRVAPDPGKPAQESLDSQQRLQSLQQEGWQVDYGGYMAVNGGWLPSRMTLQKGGVRVRLVVDGWNT